MLIFHSYVKLPKGSFPTCHGFQAIQPLLAKDSRLVEQSEVRTHQINPGSISVCNQGHPTE
jgi:hypothetical protein